MDINNLLIGENFKDFAKIYLNFPNHLEKRYYEKNNIVFCKTDLVLNFFQEIQDLDINVILITHQSDYEVNNNEPNFGPFGNLVVDWTRPWEGQTPALFKLRPKQVKKWFAQNCNYQHEDLIPIPIGLENHKGPSRGSSIDPKFWESFGEINLENLNNPKNRITDKVYLNFNNTHHNRSTVRDFLNFNGLSIEEKEKLPYSEYMKRMSNYLFVASPRGNGIDTHRTWEALYMGCIPIVEKHPQFDTYNLPIWQIESWDELLDQSKYQHWIDKYMSGKLFENASQLFMDYWKDRILKEFNNL